MEKIEKTLKQFGLSENEIAVYLATLKEPKLTPYKIHNITKIPRTTVYDTLLSLSLKKLIKLDQSDGYTKQQTLVTAKNPTNIRSLIRENKAKLDELEIDVMDIMPELVKGFSNYDTNTDFNYFKGVEGFKRVYHNRGIIPEIVCNPLFSVEFFGQDLIDEYSESVDQSPIKPKELIPWNEWTQHVLSVQYKKNSKYLERKFRYIDTASFDIQNYIALSPNRVVMASANGDEAWGVIIKSSSLYTTLKTTFELLWMSATPVTKEMMEKFTSNDLYEASKRMGCKDL